MQYLIFTYGIEEVFWWICSLNMVALPGRASEIKQMQQSAGTPEYTREEAI
jgi:hypothetical protein